MKSNIDDLLEDIQELLVAINKARGTTYNGKAPLEINFINMTTNYKRELEEFMALIEDALGKYMEGKSKK